MDLCLAARWRREALVSKWWWEQKSINLEGIRDEVQVMEVKGGGMRGTGGRGYGERFVILRWGKL